MRGFLSKYYKELGLILVLVALSIYMSFLSEYFWDFQNLLDMSRHSSEVGIIACGMTLIIMTGGIDLSVGSLLGLCCIVLGYSSKSLGLIPAMGLTMLVGFAGGAVNGLAVTGLKLPPLVVTLATMALFRGGAMAISQAKPVSDFPEYFYFLGQGSIGPIPVQLPAWIFLVLLTSYLVRKTSVGRYATAIGDNERAARYAALPVDRMKFFFYAGTGLLCAFSSIIYTSRFTTARAEAGAGLELEAITAVVLGGTAITGGRGSVLGTFLGVLILFVVRTGLSLAGISSIWQMLLTGVILICTAILNSRLGRIRKA